MIYLGTSGFAYADWKGKFYPPELAVSERLAFYAQHFRACEINASYYAWLTPASTQSMVRKSRGQVCFVVKAHQSMTHSRNAQPADYQRFNDALKPMQDAGVLGAVLVQFPYSFPQDLENRGYVADLKSQLAPGVPLVAEFRHVSWLKDEVQEFLQGQTIGFVNVDEPQLKGLLPAMDWVTSEVAYVRFHGRNAKNWFKRPAETWERYDYLYTREELEPWVPKVQQMAERSRSLFVFFNNHWQSQAVQNAKQMGELLGMPQTALPQTPDLFEQA